MSELLPLPEVEGTKCMSYGLCLDHAARYLEQDDDGITRPRADRDGVDPGDAESVRAAIRVCPANAITWSQA